MQVVRASWFSRVICYITVVIVTMGFLFSVCAEFYGRWKLRSSSRSSWVIKFPEENFFRLRHSPKNLKSLYPKVNNDLSFLKSSQYIIPKGEATNGIMYSRKLPVGDVLYKKVGFYDPAKENQFLLRTNFTECEYSKCKMTGAKESADAMIFLIAKLKNVDVPRFKRSSQQYWILKSDEAPSRFTWFESLKRPGIREAINWTLTHKSDSDIPYFYGKLMEKDSIPNKDYSRIYNGKSKIASWFVSHCPVRSRRAWYVDAMMTRIDVDIFGNCGTKSCGMADKIPGVVGMRKQADKDTCFPMMSAHYFFYLAFENSLCQEYVTEKFFKIFHEVDIVPVVRGGADYKRYFAPNSYVDAADFSTPEDLSDFLLDLASDKERYIEYLRNKNQFTFLEEHPEWQCRLCEKLHTDHRKKTYKDIHEWWTKDSCHDAMDSVLFY